MGQTKNNKRYILASFAVLLILIPTILLALSNAQIGEVAGPINFNVSLGSSQSLQYTIVNGGGTPINFYIKAAITSSIKNETTPTITANPVNGTILPHQQFPINLTVLMPSSDKPGLTWQGTVQALEASNLTAPGGAVIQTGVLKGIMVESAKPKGLPIGYVIIFVAVVAVVLILSYYLFIRRKKPSRRKAIRRKKPRQRKAIRRKKPSKRKTIRRKKPRRRKAKG